MLIASDVRALLPKGPGMTERCSTAACHLGHVSAKTAIQPRVDLDINRTLMHNYIKTGSTVNTIYFIGQ
jgi:hypothetical protein